MGFYAGQRLRGNKLFTVRTGRDGPPDGRMDGSAACVLWLFTKSASEMKERTEARFVSGLAFAGRVLRLESEQICATDRRLVNPFLDFLASLLPSSLLPSDHFLNYLDRAKVKPARVHLSIHVTSRPIDA